MTLPLQKNNTTTQKFKVFKQKILQSLVIKFLKALTKTKLRVLLLFIVGTCAAWGIERTLDWYFPEPNQQTVAQSESGLSPRVKEESTSTEFIPGVEADNSRCYLILEKFKDLSMWNKSETFHILNLNPLRIIAPASENFAGWVMDFKNPTPIVFEAGFTFTPHGDQPNVEFRFGPIFSFIVGDRTYNRVAVKNYGVYKAPKGYITQHYRLPEFMKKDSEVRVLLTTRLVEGTNKVIITAVLNYFDPMGSSITRSTPEFVIQTKENPKNIKDYIGVGLIDTAKTGKIEATFSELTVRQDIFEKCIAKNEEAIPTF